VFTAISLQGNRLIKVRDECGKQAENASTGTRVHKTTTKTRNLTFSAQDILKASQKNNGRLR
jgi:hypothetical protein